MTEHGGASVSENNNPQTTETTVAEQLQQLVERAGKGDASALPALRQFLDLNPVLWQEFGDLSRHAEQALLNLAAGNNLHLRECLVRKLAELKQELAGPDPTPLERLLVARVAACWLQVSYFDALQAQTRPLTPAQAQQLQRQQEGAQRRFLAATRALASVRKLLPSPRPAKPSARTFLPKGPRFSGVTNDLDLLANGIASLN
jgi:hypothetical protein